MSTAKPMTKSWIQKSPGICGGEPYVRNTRHRVAGLVEWKKQGLTEARILEHHPDLTQADLEAAWVYYDAHREEIDRLSRRMWKRKRWPGVSQPHPSSAPKRPATAGSVATHQPPQFISDIPSFMHLSKGHAKDTIVGSVPLVIV